VMRREDERPFPEYASNRSSVRVFGGLAGGALCAPLPFEALPW